MATSVEIRDLDDEVYAGLVRHASEAGITVPELLRRHAGRLAARPVMSDWLERSGARPSGISSDEVIEALDELRGPWPEARR